MVDSEVLGFSCVQGQALLLVQAEGASELASGSSSVGVQIPYFGFDGDVSRSRLKMAQQSSKGQEFWSVEAAQPRFFVASPLDFSPSIWEILAIAAIGHPCGWCRFTRLCGQCVSNPSSIPQVSDESFGPRKINSFGFLAWNLGLRGSRRPPKQSFSEAAVGSQWFSTRKGRCMRSAGCLTDDLKSSSIWRLASQLVSEDSEDKHRNTISWRFLISMDGQQYSFFPFCLWHI